MAEGLKCHAGEYEFYPGQGAWERILYAGGGSWLMLRGGRADDGVREEDEGAQAGGGSRAPGGK